MGALSDVVVLEVHTGVAGSYAGRLLCDLGAQVVRLEPPAGDPLRHEPPVVDGESAFFNWLNASKLSVELDIEPRIHELFRNSDIVIHELRGELADMFESHCAQHAPHAVVLSISPYGRSGERSTWKSTEFTDYATSGYHFFGGDPAREPLALHGHQSGFHAGVHGANAVLAGLFHARATGQGQRIEVSAQEAMLSDHAWLVTMWTHTGQVQRRTGALFAPCADGFVYLFTLAPYPNLFILMERFDLLEDEELLQPLNWQARFNEVFEAFSQWAATRTKHEIYHACQELRVAVSPINNMADLVESPQLQARDYFDTVFVADREITAPGFPYKLAGTPCENDGRAAPAGEHTDAVFAPDFAWANAAVERTSAADNAAGDGPLAGVRVLELCAHWAGPQAGKWLADLGADVIKIELQTKPSTRGLIPVGGDLWPEHFNRAGYFNKHNRNKRDLSLNLSHPLGKETFLKLVAKADVVLENFSARVMPNLGLAFSDLAKVNPRIVMCSVSGYGATGPEKDYSAFGSNVETASGLASVLGYGPGEYFGTGTFYADPITGNHAAVAILAALHHAKRTGEGQWIDASLIECALPLFSQALLEFTATGRVPEPRANRHHTQSPQGVYPSAGTDCWLAVTVPDDATWDALCEAIAKPEWNGKDLAWRRQNASDIDAAIAAWSRELDHMNGARKLQEAGIPASPVLANWEIASDNHLHDRGFFVPVRHESAGTHFFPGFPWRFEKTPVRIRRAAPRFAEHNHDVLRDIAGYAEDEIARLYDEDVTGDDPIYAQIGGL